MLNPATNFARCLHARVADEHATPVAPGRCPEKAQRWRPNVALGTISVGRLLLAPMQPRFWVRAWRVGKGGPQPRRTDERPPPRHERDAARRALAVHQGAWPTCDGSRQRD